MRHAVMRSDNFIGCGNSPARTLSHIVVSPIGKIPCRSGGGLDDASCAIFGGDLLSLRAAVVASCAMR